jgi:polysaccharide biosynthesis protein PslG
VWGVPQVDQRIAEIKSRGMQILLVLYWAPEWATGTAAKNGVPKNPADYAAAASYAAHRWGDSVDAWEVWNEPDSAAFWAHPSVTDYAALLKASYPAFKNADPSATVVAGAPTYVNTKWYAQLYRAGAQPYFDVVGVHPYMSPGDLPPGLPDDATMNHLRHLDTLVALMARHGDAKKPIWATELGWSVHANPSGTPPWERGVTEAQQAKYLTDAVAVLRTFPQVDALFWYNSNDSQISGPHVGRFGLLREDGSPRPALDALGCAARGGC